MNFSRFAENMIIALYQEADNGTEHCTFGGLAKRYGMQSRLNWVVQLASEWERNGYANVRKHIGDPETWGIAIAAAGMRYVESEYSSKDGFISVLEPFSEGQESSERKLTVSDQVDATIIPASDRSVSLSHNQITEAEEPLEEIIKTVEFGNGDPDEPSFRQRIIGQLRAGRELIRSGEYKIAVLQITLIAALNELVVRYKDGIIAGLAANLLQYIITNGLN